MTAANASAETENALRRAKILAAVVAHVPFDGWTWRSVGRGANDAGYSEAEAHLAFPEGIREVAAAYSAELDRRMRDALEARGTELGTLKIRERVALAVRLRLESAGREREAVRRLVAFLALPENLGLGTRLLWTTVDVIWRAVGDRSVDFSHYTKRGLLAGVVGATVLYWLTDESEGFLDTWAFLDRRIGEVMVVGSLPRRLGAWVETQWDKMGGGTLFRGRRRPRPSRGAGDRTPPTAAGDDRSNRL